MTRANAIAAASLSAFAAFAASPVYAGTTALKPLHAVSFEIGAERAVGYFTARDGGCRLVVTRAVSPDGRSDGHTVHRFETSISAGLSTRYAGVVTFACAADAASMSVTRDAQFAAAVK
ncbi:MAG: hypothetical protein ACT4OU_07885 [Hyphomicrobium sp.]